MLHVVVVGAGPAGLQASKLLARAGIKATLLEATPGRVRPCAGLLSSALLSRFGLSELLLAQRVGEISLHSPARQTAFLGIQRSDRFAGTLRYELLQTFMRREAEEAGVNLVHGRFRRFRHGEGDYPLVEFVRPDGRREQLEADIVIAADGAHSAVARSLGLDPLPLGVAFHERFVRAASEQPIDALQLHFGRKLSADALGWVMPQDDQVVLGVSTSLRYGRRVWDMLAELKRRVPLDGLKAAGHEAWCYPLEQRARLCHDRVMLVGDAAGLVPGHLPDGLYYALESGALAAQTIISHRNLPLPARLVDYETAWQARYAEVFEGYRRLKAAYLGNDRRREALVQLAWDREAQALAVEAFLEKRRFAPSWGLKLRLTGRQVSQLVRSRMKGPRRQEGDWVGQALPAPLNYLDLALGTPDELLECRVAANEPEPRPVELGSQGG